MRTRSQRLLSMVLALSMLLTFLPVSAFAENTPPSYAVSNADTQTLDNNGTYTDRSNNENNEYKYALNTDGTATLTKFTGKHANVPEKVTKGTETYRVTAIGANAFAIMGSDNHHKDNKTLQSVKLPNTITVIGDHAFAYCESIETIQIPDDVDMIQVGTFTSCTSLANVSLPAQLTTIGEGAFSDCSALHSIKLPEGLTTVKDAAFHGAKLETIDWPESLTTVGVFAFQNATNVTPGASKPTSSTQPIKTITYPGTETDWQRLLNRYTDGGYTVAATNPQLVPKDTEHPNGVDLHCAHTVTFNVNGHSTEQVVQYEGYVDTSKVDTPTEKGYTFKGWYTAAEGGDPFDFTAEITEDKTAYAQWEKETTPEKPSQPTTPDAPTVEEDDTAAIGYAAAAVTAAFVGWGAYRIGSEVYLKYLLPNDVLLPQNRIQLAELLWEDAGRPAPADAAAYTDVDDTDARQAARWAVENGLLTLPDTEKPEDFVPYRSVSYAKSARAWNQAQQLKENAAAR